MIIHLEEFETYQQVALRYILLLVIYYELSHVRVIIPNNTNNNTNNNNTNSNANNKAYLGRRNGLDELLGGLPDGAVDAERLGLLSCSELTVRSGRPAGALAELRTMYDIQSKI